MDGNTQIIIALIFAVVVLGLAWRYRGKIKASIKVPGAEMSVEGENPEPRITDSGNTADSGDTTDSAVEVAPAPAHNAPAGEAGGGVSIEEAKAGGGILAEANDGGGVEMKKVEAGDDIIASASKPEDAPKANRP